MAAFYVAIEEANIAIAQTSTDTRNILRDSSLTTAASFALVQKNADLRSTSEVVTIKGERWLKITIPAEKTIRITWGGQLRIPISGGYAFSLEAYTEGEPFRSVMFILARKEGVVPKSSTITRDTEVTNTSRMLSISGNLESEINNILVFMDIPKASTERVVYVRNLMFTNSSSPCAYTPHPEDIAEDIAEAKAIRTPEIDPATKRWKLWDESQRALVLTNFSAVGDDGHSPYVSTRTKTWWEYDPARPTTQAAGEKMGYRDTSIKAQGEKGQKGDKGDAGARGADGRNAPMTSIPTIHDPAATYISNDTYASIVIGADNRFYKALKDVPANTPLTNREYWQLISSITQAGFIEAYASTLFATKAFINALSANEIEANVIKAGVNKDAPQGFNALIDSNGFGHLGGGAFTFNGEGMQLGSFSVDKNTVAIKDEQGEVRVMYSNGYVDPLADIQNKGSFGAAVNGFRESFMLSDYRKIGRYRNEQDPRDLSIFAFSGSKERAFFSTDKNGTRLEFRLSCELRYPQSRPTDVRRANLYIKLFSPTYERTLHYGWDERYGIENQTVTVDNLPKGQYTIKATVQADMAVEEGHPDVGFSFTIDNARWAADAKSYRRLAFYQDGWYMSYPDMLLYLSREEGLVYHGKMDMPGVICAARIDAYKMARYFWGKRAIPKGEPTPRASRDSSGVYTVHHSIGHTNYIPMVTPQYSGAAMVEMLDVYVDRFTFKIYNRSGSTISCAFNYQCMGEN